MNSIFELCSNIYYGPYRKKYKMISTGSNDLPMPRIWKKLITQEVKNDLVYMWYTAPGGLAAERNYLKMYHEILSTKGKSLVSKKRDVCMTLGACQAAKIIFDYLIQRKKIKKVLILGYSYSLFERECRRYNLMYQELSSCKKGKNLPSVSEIKNSKSDADLFILSLPSNPTGEIWRQNEFESFLKYIKESKKIVLLDIVGYFQISERNNLLFDYAIRKIGIEEQVYIINSFSKSDSVPAFRLGYLIGCGDLYQFAANSQYDEMMNVPIFPVIPMLFSLHARIIFMNRKYRWEIDEKRFKSIAYNLLKESFALLSPKWEKKIYHLFYGNKFNRYYRTYVNEQLKNERIILRNYEYMLNVLKDDIVDWIHMESGFNVIIELKGTEFFEEYEFCKKLLSYNGLSVLTESCFTIEQRRENRFWIRISLAKEESYFKKSIIMLRKFLIILKENNYKLNTR
ncbi:MAG: aminotransferase class I/II-fold pyridoxal phosphate-dependent enzyme [Lachnospiraceae bacterium]|nr:aminotransferase class I/II-fold pyridoxal phosphate-dependent enzyme [Lachnospiraceae bacterium]